MDDKLNILKNWKLHVTVLIACMISDRIGAVSFPITDSIKVTLLPLLYSMAIMAAIYLFKPITWVKLEQTKLAGYMMNITVVILGAKLGVNIATSLEAIISAGAPLLVQNFGDAFTAVVALPIALKLGIKRQSIGLTFANSREGGMGVISNQYGADSEEFQGVVAMYITGTVFGTILVGLMSSIFTGIGLFHPYAAAMAAGVGSAAMSTAGIGTLTELYPGMAAEITAFTTVSNVISSAISVYIGIFVGLPLTEFMYKKLEPSIGKKSREKLLKADYNAKEEK